MFDLATDRILYLWIRDEADVMPQPVRRIVEVDEQEGAKTVERWLAVRPRDITQAVAITK